MCTVPLDIKIHLMICSIKFEYYVCLISCLYGCDVVCAVSRCIVRPSYIRVYLTGRVLALGIMGLHVQLPVVKK